MIRRPVPIFLLVAALACVGCSSKKMIVVDQSGKPVQGVQVRPIAPSINGEAAHTDANGEAIISLNCGGQTAKWIHVQAPGLVYEPIEVEVPANWPLRITLAPFGRTLSQTSLPGQLTTRP